MSRDQPTPLRVGVLLLAPVQLLDVGPVDLFGMLSPEYLAACRLPAALIALGIPVAIRYISSTPLASASSPTANPSSSTAIAPCTASAGLALNADISSPAALDILLIPGPDPAAPVPDDVCEFLRMQARAGVVLMSVCSGVFPLAAAGVLQGRSATGPRGLLGELRTKYPDTRWVERRWERDGNIWCSGGITNGLDMVAAYLKEKYPGPLSDTVCAIADVGDRAQEYGTGRARESAWWLWLILRAWFAGPKAVKGSKSL